MWSRLGHGLRPGPSESTRLFRRGLRLPALAWLAALPLWEATELEVFSARWAARLESLLAMVLVAAVTLPVAVKAAADVSGLLAEPAPFVRLNPGFGAYSLDFTLICRVASFVDPSLAQHELRKRILRRSREEGLEIPLPVRTVELRRRRPARRAAAELANPAAGG